MNDSQKKKLENIKLFLFDVDGILTDGKISWDSKLEEFIRTFHIRDGYGIRLLLEQGYKVGVISGGKSFNVKKRVEYLGMDYCYLGHFDKTIPFKECLEKSGYTADQALYMGDDLFDIPVLDLVGFSATVPDAPQKVLDSADYITEKTGGNGAVREVIDWFLSTQ